MQIIKHPSPNFNERPENRGIDMIVIHYTDMLTARDALERLCDPAHEVSAHYLISKDGVIYQMVDEDKRAWHAGVSEWDGESDLNNCSIGIELDNPGLTHGLAPFPDEQIEALVHLCKDIQTRHSIPPERVVGHEHIAPERKKDPGPLFPWKALKANNIAIIS